MERVAKAVARGIGTLAFEVIGAATILAWALIDGAIRYLERTVGDIVHGNQFDAEPWILLNVTGVAVCTGR